jgi:hypothetical protein
MTLRLVLLVVLVTTLRAAPAHAQSTLTLSGDPAPLVVSTAVAGNAPDPVMERSTTYSLSAIDITSRITARLDAALPPGVTLKVSLAAPPGATSSGPVALSTTEQDVVRGILTGSYTGLSITYTLQATSGAGVVPPSAPSVTFTVLAQP